MELEEHYIETEHKGWPLVKILSVFIAVLIVFGSGVAVGKGDVHFWRNKASANGPLDYSSVTQLYNLLRSDFDGNLDKNKLLDGVKSGLVSATGDPYTVYFSPSEAKEFDSQLEGSITGIGAELGTDDQNNIVIVSPLSGYPAEKAGLKPKDIIAAINNQTTQGMSVDAAVSKIRGTPGTKVTLSIVRGGAQAINITITREKITIPSVKYQVDGDIGYLKISQFGSDTVDLAQKAAYDFKSKNVKGIVLDLRGNPGGYLSSAVGVSSLWLDKGKIIVQERRGGEVVSTETASGNNLLHGLPTVVLIDGGSASASEITAGALHDNKVAQLVGVKSFGKGSVQQVESLSNGGELKVTIARWFTPSGKNIDKQGINPDVAISISDDDIKNGTDPQKDKAYEIVHNGL